MSITPEQADQQLHDAAALDRLTAAFNPAWLSYVFLTAATSSYTLGFWYVQETGGLLWPVIATTLGWVILGLVVTAFTLIRHRHNRRGFSYRWMALMVAWMMTWILAPIPADPVWAVVLTLLYPGYAVIGITWEFLAERR